jgi:hypothetical protein
MYQQRKVSGNHSNSYDEFCLGRLDIYYLHFWLSLKNTQLWIGPDVAFESSYVSAAKSSLSFVKKQKEWKNTADVSELHLQMHTEAEAKSRADGLIS